MTIEQIHPDESSRSSRILVVLPTLGDRLSTLRETLETIKAEKSLVSLRLVVVAPSSAHEARALAKTYGATLIDDPKLGISEAINLGVKAREGEEYYAWMGDDDLFRFGGLSILQDLLDSDKSAIASYGACEYIDPEGRILATNRAGKLAQFLLAWGPDLIPHPGSMIRINELEAIGGFDQSLKYAMDLDAFLKLQKRGKFACTTQVVSAFRWHPDSLTVANRMNSTRESEAVKAKHLPKYLSPFRFFWLYPVRWASYYAARKISQIAKKYKPTN